MENIFGTPAEIPKAVRVEDLTAPNFKREEEYISYEPVSEGEEGSDFRLEEMLSSNVEEGLRKMEAELDGEGPAADRLDDIPGTIPEDPEMGFGVDDLDAGMMAEMWNDLRVSVHGGIYDWAIFKHPKRAGQILKELSIKDQKTEAEKALMEELWKYKDKHDELRGEYMSAVPYSEKHQALLVRFIEYQMNRMRQQGRAFPRWLMWAYLFIVPEVQAGIKFAKIRSEMPQFNFDFEQFQRQQNGA